MFILRTCFVGENILVICNIKIVKIVNYTSQLFKIQIIWLNITNFFFCYYGPHEKKVMGTIGHLLMVEKLL